MNNDYKIKKDFVNQSVQNTPSKITFFFNVILSGFFSNTLTSPSNLCHNTYKHPIFLTPHI